MIFVESPHPKGAVSFVGQEIARYHQFTVCFTGLNVPANTELFTGIGYNVAYNRNAVIDTAFNTCKQCTHKHRDKDCDKCTCDKFTDRELQWVQIWDDDHIFAPETCIALLERNVDIVVPFYVQRQPPYRPCIYKDMTSEGWRIYEWKDLEGKDGLLPVAAAGAGGILIKRHVIEKLGLDKPSWFEHELGVGEDMTFFKKCIDAGFQPYVALDVAIGHATPVEVWPNKHATKGFWGAKVNLLGAPPQYVEYWAKEYQGKA